MSAFPQSSLALGDFAPTFADSDQPRDFRTVLIVDDDSSIRTLTAMMLTPQGFKTFAARNGLEALEMLQQHPEIDAVLLDVEMPVMNGADAFREMRENWPGVAVFVISGFGAAELNIRFGTPSPYGFIQKPFTGAKLIGDLRCALT